LFARVSGDTLAKCGKRVEPSAWTIFAGGNTRVFPMTFQKTHVLEAGERSIQRAVRNEQLGIGDFLKPLRHLVSVKFVLEVQRLIANRAFKREELARFASHRKIISRYMLIKSTARFFRSY
jgi:hypothetical protein